MSAHREITIPVNAVERTFLQVHAEGAVTAGKAPEGDTAGAIGAEPAACPRILDSKSG
jgi:hypothetical protein